MKLMDSLVSMVVKKGVIYEARNVDVRFEVPVQTYTDKGIPLDTLLIVRIDFKAEHMTLRIEKGEE